MRAQQLLNDLGRLSGLGELALDEAGRLTLRFDDSVEVTFEEEAQDGRLVLSALLGEVGAEPSPAVLSELLDANFFWQRTGGATVAVERVSGRVVMTEALRLQGLDVPTFEVAVETFVAAAVRLSRRLAGDSGETIGDLIPGPVAGLAAMLRA
jgi:hypothetical protein